MKKFTTYKLWCDYLLSLSKKKFHTASSLHHSRISFINRMKLASSNNPIVPQLRRTG